MHSSSFMPHFHFRCRGARGAEMGVVELIFAFAGEERERERWIWRRSTASIRRHRIESIRRTLLARPLRGRPSAKAEGDDDLGGVAHQINEEEHCPLGHDGVGMALRWS